MINSNLYFELPSYTKLDATGRYVLYIHNENEVEFTAEINNGPIEITEVVHSIVNSYIVLNILDLNSDFSITIKDIYGNSDTIVLNSGDPEFLFTLNNLPQGNVSYKTNVVELDFKVLGYNKNNIEITSDKQTTRIPYNPSSSVSPLPFSLYSITGALHKTVDINYPNLTPLDIYIKAGNRFIKSASDLVIPPYMVYQQIINLGLSSNQVYLHFKDVAPNFVYIGYSDKENVLIYNTELDLLNNKIRLYIAPNTSAKIRQQTITITCEDFSQNITITQEKNPEAPYVDYDNSNLPALFNTNEHKYKLNINIPSNFVFSINSFNPNVNTVTNPYTVTCNKIDSKSVEITYSVDSTYDNKYSRTYEQQILLELRLLDKRYNPSLYYTVLPINLSFNAAGLIYSTGDITIDSNNSVIANINLDENNITSLEYTNLPSWLTKDNFIFSNNIITVTNVEANTSDIQRIANISAIANRESGGTYASPLEFKVIQFPVSDDSNTYHKTFEDYYFEPDTEFERIDIYLPEEERYIYSGVISDKLKLTDFAKSLFNDKITIFENSFANLNLVKPLYMYYAGRNYKENFIYDYSYDTTNHFNITEIRQAIDYYDPKQYIFESIFVFPNAPRDIQLNDRQYLNTKNYNKYNITMDGASNETMQLSYHQGELLRKGILYKQKCTNAKYAIYYLNSYGGWNWMLFEGNKQIKNYNTTFDNYLNDNVELLPYKTNTSTNYNLTSLYLTDEGSKKLKDLYKSIVVILHDFETNKLIRVTIDTKSYTEKTFINQGRKFFTQSITVKESKNKIGY